MADDPLLDDVAGAVLDGDAVNWAEVEARADAAATPVVKHLQVLSIVAGVHRHKASDAPPDRVPDMPERSWGHLRLLERIGRGAFGEVYRAWDTRLDREVALKLLPAPAVGESAASSIIEEGRLIARVRHPAVVTIHGAEQIGDRVGLWMEYVRGRTLEESLDAGDPFKPRDVMHIGRELCGAVAAVHAAGLLHRDIKAHNVIRADDGRVVLMDFGTGMEAAAARTAPAGTPLYLAPELFAGQPASVQSDVYSLGVLLYHLLTGKYPVGGRSLHEVRLAHERGERTALTDVRPDLPRRLIRAVEHAIDPQPERRLESAAALAAALQSAERGFRRRWIGYGGLAAAAAAVLTVWLGQTGQRDPGASPSLADAARAPAVSWWAGLWHAKRPAIAVLPFRNLGTVAGSDLMADGLTYEITNILATVDGLDIRSAASSFAFKGKPPDLAAVGGRLRADMAVEGELFASEDQVRVFARLVRVADDVTMWADTFDRRGRDVMGIQRDLAMAIANRLRLTLGGGQRRYEIDPVLQLKFLMARGLAEKRQPPFSIEAIRLFEEIVAEIPSYAPAWAGLASAIDSIARLRPESVTELLPRMREAAHEAYKLDPLLAEASAAMGSLHARDLDWPQARRFFAEALSRNRSLTTIHADAVLTLLLPLDELDEAKALLEVARTVDPLSLDVPRTLALIQLEAGEYEEAIRNARWVLEQDPNYPFAATWLGRAMALTGRPDEALRYFERGRSGSGYIGYVYAVTGRRAEAEALAASTVNPSMQLLIYGGLGDKERAFHALELVLASNPWRAATWMLRPEVAILRDDPRFGEIRRRLGDAD